MPGESISTCRGFKSNFKHLYGVSAEKEGLALNVTSDTGGGILFECGMAEFLIKKYMLYVSLGVNAHGETKRATLFKTIGRPGHSSSLSRGLQQWRERCGSPKCK